MIFPELVKTVNATPARTPPPYSGDRTVLDRDDLIPQNTRKTAPSAETRANPTALDRDVHVRQSLSPRHSTGDSIGIRPNGPSTLFFFYRPSPNSPR